MTLANGAPEPAPAGSQPGRLRRLWAGHWGALLIGVAFVLLALLYNVSIPLWESDNEWGHFNYVRYLLLNRTLPGPGSMVNEPISADQCSNILIPNPGPDAPANTASHQLERQPPLYYLGGALATAWIDSEAGLTLAVNPYLFNEPWRNGFNFAVHSRAEGFPYQGVALAVHLLRLYSTLIGLAGLAAIYLTALLIFPERRYLAVAVMAVSAFIPMYLFAASVVNNDILAAALAFWCIYFCVRAVLRQGGLWVLAAAAGLAVLAMLAKYSSLPLIGLVAATAVIRLVQVRRQDRRRFTSMLWQTALLFGLLAVPLLVWMMRSLSFLDKVVDFYARVIGALAGNPAIEAGAVDAARAAAPFDLLRAGQYGFISFWGLFGWDSIVLPSWVILALAAVAGIALAGIVRCLLDKSQPRAIRLLVVGALLFLAATWAISTLRALGTSEPRGRYLLPAYPAATFLLVYGVHELLPRRARKGGLAALGGAFLALALAVPLLLLRPIYAPPALAANADLLPGETAASATFGDFAELIGYRIEPQQMQVFDTATVTLVWRVLKEVDSNFTVAVHLLDGAGQSHGLTAHFPGRGNYATSLWQPGDVFRDSYELSLSPSARGRLPSLGQIKVTMYCYPEEEYVLITDSLGAPVGDALYVGRMKWTSASASPAAASGPPAATLGDQLSLRSLAVVNPDPLPGEELVMELVWEVLQPPGRDLTVFAHLLDADGVQVGGNDLPMTGGFYPSGLWAAGEVITHTHRLPAPANLPGGDYQVVLGVYDPQTGQRLPVRMADGVEAPGGSLLAATLHVPANRLYLPQIEVDGAANR